MHIHNFLCLPPMMFMRLIHFRKTERPVTGQVYTRGKRVVSNSLENDS